MGKKLLLLICILQAIPAIFAQSGFQPATETQQNEIIRQITESSKELKTLRCDFVQRKTISILADEMVAEGSLSFKQTDNVRWEYAKPYQYEFVMNGDKVMVSSETTKNVIDINSSKVFREISKIIISGINGAGIFDQSKFVTEFMVSAKEHMVILMPKQKEIKQLFNKIYICFNTSDNTVNSIEIEEFNKDKTFIEMKNKQINKELNDEVFNIR